MRKKTIATGIIASACVAAVVMIGGIGNSLWTKTKK